MKQFLFGDESANADVVDSVIVVLLMLFLFSSTVSIAAMSISYGAAALLWYGRRLIRKECGFPKTPLNKFVLAYAAVALLSLAFSVYKEQALLYTYRRLSLLPIMYVVVESISSRRLLKILLGTLLLSMVLVALWSARDVILHLHEYILFQRRSSEFQMYMTAGGMMMIGMLLLLPFVVHAATPKLMRWLAIAMMIPIGVNLLFTFTRSSWLGFLTGAIVIGAMRAKRLFILLAVLVVSVVMLSSPEMQERMSSIFNPYHATNIKRLQMWQTGIAIFQAYPLVGVGDIGIEHVWKNFAPPEWKPEGHLHNNFIMWLVTLGAIGFTVVIALFAKVWLTMQRIEKKLHGDWFLGSIALGGLAVLAGFLMNGMFEWNFGDAEIIMSVWAIVGMVLSAEKIASCEAQRA